MYLRLPQAPHWTVVAAAAAMVLVVCLASVELAAASFPGGNGRIAFTRGAIFTVNPDGSDLQQLTAGPSPPPNFAPGDTQPSWSPAGQRLTFVRGGVIWLMNADGSEQRPLHEAGVGNESPTFSPGGDRLIYVHRSNAVKSIGLDGTGARTVLRASHRKSPVDGPIEGSVVAPNGRLIAFFVGNEGVQWRRDFGIWTVRPNGRDLSQLTSPSRPSHHAEPDFSPDGTTLAFQRGRHGRLFTIDIGGGRPRVLSGQYPYNCDPVFSPDGLQIAAVGGFGALSPHGTACHDLYAVPASGGNRQAILNGASQPSWQPLP